VKITHVVENLNRGGLERVVINLVLAQRAAGHDCRVICLHESGSLAHELIDHGVAVDACNKRNGTDLGALIRARGLLRRNGVDIVHSHNIIAHDYAMLAAAGLNPRRIINTRHGMGGPPLANAREWLYRRCMRRTDHVVAVCEAARHNLIEQGRLPADKLVAVPNGIHVERFSPVSEAARRRLAQMIEVGESTRIIGSVGRLNWAKDIPTLIRAFALLRGRQPDSVLVVIGDGSLRQELVAFAAEEGVAEHVRFLGDRSDVRELLQGLHVLAMSSVSEGYSIALLEACAAALPIVATAVGGNAEIVHDGVNGHVVPSRDPGMLAEGLLDILADPARADAMGRAGREWVLQHGTFDGMVRRYEALYGGESPQKA
jgi:sugar transferase (PEP-CTERM/EpsH1 system associated)